MSDISEDLVFSTKPAKLELDIVVDDKPVTLRFKSIAQIPAEELFYEGSERMLDSTSIMAVSLKWALDAESHKVLMKLPMRHWRQILGQMGELSDAELGKSLDSSTSSKSTGRRSKQTSSDSDSD